MSFTVVDGGGDNLDGRRKDIARAVLGLGAAGAEVLLPDVRRVGHERVRGVGHYLRIKAPVGIYQNPDQAAPPYTLHGVNYVKDSVAACNYARTWALNPTANHPSAGPTDANKNERGLNLFTAGFETCFGWDPQSTKGAGIR